MKSEFFRKLYFFDHPTVGYCPKCDKMAIYTNKGLICPKCKSQDISIFVWDKNSKYPVVD